MEDWAVRLNKNHAPSVVNNTIGTMRGVLDIPLKAGLISTNHATILKKVRVKTKELNLPTSQQFKTFVKHIRNAGSRHSKGCAEMVSLLAFTGKRLSEAIHLKWETLISKGKPFESKAHPKRAQKTARSDLFPLFLTVKFC